MAEKNPELQKHAKKGETAIRGSITQPDLSGTTRPQDPHGGSIPLRFGHDQPEPAIEGYVESIEEDENGVTIRLRKP